MEIEQISYDEVIKRIRTFEKEHPEKIAEWNKTEDVINKVDRDKSNSRNIEVDDLINKCMLVSPKSKFVLSVKMQFERKGFVSDKQIAVLDRILDSSKIGEDYFR